MKCRGLLLCIFLLSFGNLVWGQSGIYDDPYFGSEAQLPQWQQADCNFQMASPAFHSEYTVPFAAQDLEGLNAIYAPRRTPPVIGGDDTPPDTPTFRSPVGDVPIGFMLLLAALCALCTYLHRRRCG